MQSVWLMVFGAAATTLSLRRLEQTFQLEPELIAAVDVGFLVDMAHVRLCGAVGHAELLGDVPHAFVRAKEGCNLGLARGKAQCGEYVAAEGKQAAEEQNGK